MSLLPKIGKNPSIPFVSRRKASAEELKRQAPGIHVNKVADGEPNAGERYLATLHCPRSGDGTHRFELLTGKGGVELGHQCRACGCWAEVAGHRWDEQPPPGSGQDWTPYFQSQASDPRDGRPR